MESGKVKYFCAAFICLPTNENVFSVRVASVCVALSSLFRRQSVDCFRYTTREGITASWGRGRQEEKSTKYFLFFSTSSLFSSSVAKNNSTAIRLFNFLLCSPESILWNRCFILWYKYHSRQYSLSTAACYHRHCMKKKGLSPRIELMIRFRATYIQIIHRGDRHCTVHNPYLVCLTVSFPFINTSKYVSIHTI